MPPSLLLESPPKPANPMILVQELNHRVMNEYTAAIASLSLAAAEMASSEGRAVLARAQTRLHAFANVHRALQPPTCSAEVDLGAYLERVCSAMAKASLAQHRLSLSLPGYDVIVDPLHAWRLGLIVAELITNAARHGDGEEEILVELGVVADEVVCSVFNPGVFEPDVQRSSGLRVVEGLASDIDGRLERSFGPDGAMVLIASPCADAAVRFA